MSPKAHTPKQQKKQSLQAHSATCAKQLPINFNVLLKQLVISAINDAIRDTSGAMLSTSKTWIPWMDSISMDSILL